MGTLTTLFVGLCTHIQKPEVTNQLHRVVLVNAIIPQEFDGDRTVPSHQPLLRIRAADIDHLDGIRLPDPDNGTVTWPLDGAMFWVRNAVPETPGPVSYSKNYGQCMPALSLTPNLPLPSTAVVRDRQVSRASCYFNVNAGAFDVRSTKPGMSDGAVFAVLTTTTSDYNPVLEVASFTWGSGSITFRNTAEITILNTGVVEDPEIKYDFLVHYRIFESTPPNLYIPEETCADLPGWPDRFPPINIGPGCSNSNYP